MLFNKKLYYNYANTLENICAVLLIMYLLISIFIGLHFFQIKGLLIAIVIVAITGYPPYMHVRIKVEEMKWKLDIYNTIMKKEITENTKNEYSQKFDI